MKAVFKAIVLAGIASFAVFGQAVAATTPHKTPAAHPAAPKALRHATVAKKHTATTHGRSHAASTSQHTAASTHRGTTVAHAKTTHSKQQSIASAKRTHVRSAPAHKIVKTKS
jgi:hypothetical protein